MYRRVNRGEGHRLHRSIFALLVTCTLGLTTACGGAGQSASQQEASQSGAGQTTIKVGYHPDLHAAGIIAVGKKQGFWKKAGVNVQAKQFSSGTTLIQAMAAGDVDLGYIGPGATWLAARGRATVVTVDSLNRGDYVIGQASITSLKDLEGKTVGYPIGTSGEMILRLALRKAGLSMDDIKKRPLDPSAVVSAFVTGEIDAAAIWVPLASKIRKRVPDANFLINNSAFAPKYQFPQMWVGNTTFVQENPQAVQKFLRGFILANDFRAKNTDAAIQATVEFTEVPKDALVAQDETTKWLTSDQLLQAYTSGKVYQWYTKLEKLFVTMGKLPEVVPPKDFTNFELFKQAKQSLSSQGS